MSAGPKIFLLKSSDFDSDSFRKQLANSDKLSHHSSYIFEKPSDIECFKNKSVLNTSLFFIIPYSQLDKIRDIKRSFNSFHSCRYLVIDPVPCLDNALLVSKRGADKYLNQCAQEVASYIQKTKLNLPSQLGLHDTPSNIGLNEQDFFCSMIGRSSVMRDVFARIKQVAKSSSTVLITGASGCGKELVAQAIHQLSNRSSSRQVSINCGAIPSELLESELFGHTKGSFTGAISDKKGKFELADEGTIFLDEIGDMDQKLQVKLLRTLQQKQIEAVGSDTPRDIDVRIIAATHQDLEQLVQNKSFREDLYYRLNVIPIHLPELKKRKEDIPLLISYFIGQIVKRDGMKPIEFSKQSLSLLLNYQWPGNIRELENLIERLMVLRSGHFIEAFDLPHNIFSQQLESQEQSSLLPEDGMDLKGYLAKIELNFIEQALERTGGNKKQASQLLSIKRTTLVEKLKKIQNSPQEHNEYS